MCRNRWLFESICTELVEILSLGDNENIKCVFNQEEYGENVHFTSESGKTAIAISTLYDIRTVTVERVQLVHTREGSFSRFMRRMCSSLYNSGVAQVEILNAANTALAGWCKKFGLKPFTPIRCEGQPTAGYRGSMCDLYYALVIKYPDADRLWREKYNRCKKPALPTYAPSEECPNVDQTSLTVITEKTHLTADDIQTMLLSPFFKDTYGERNINIACARIFNGEKFTSIARKVGLSSSYISSITHKVIRGIYRYTRRFRSEGAAFFTQTAEEVEARERAEELAKYTVDGYHMQLDKTFTECEDIITIPGTRARKALGLEGVKTIRGLYHWCQGNTLLSVYGVGRISGAEICKYCGECLQLSDITCVAKHRVADVLVKVNRKEVSIEQVLSALSAGLDIPVDRLREILNDRLYLTLK